MRQKILKTLPDGLPIFCVRAMVQITLTFCVVLPVYADTVSPDMGSLIKKRRKRMRKKKHRKMLKRTRAQRQRGK
jgi:hypothetical protein